MADLDDFFAKRDKKKKSGKKNQFETTEDLKNILGKKVEERKKLEEGKSQYVSEDGQTNTTAQEKEDDEWIDAEEKKPDYSGLKIQELILESDDEIEGKEQETREWGDNSTKDGPWKKKTAGGSGEVSSTATPVATPVEADVTLETIAVEPSSTDEPAAVSEEKTSAPPAASTGGRYVPPSMRGKAQETASAGGAAPVPTSRPSEPSGLSDGLPKGAYVPPGRRGASSMSSSASVASKPRKTGAAPNLNDEEYFPSLGGS